MSLQRWNAKRDANEKPIVDALRAAGGWQAPIRERITTLRARISRLEFREAPGGNFVITSEHADGLLDAIEELLPSAPRAQGERSQK